MTKIGWKSGSPKQRVKLARDTQTLQTARLEEDDLLASRMQVLASRWFYASDCFRCCTGEYEYMTTSVLSNRLLPMIVSSPFPSVDRCARCLCDPRPRRTDIRCAEGHTEHTAWICGGSIAMGIGIWTICIASAMEAFQLPVLVMYDWPTVLLSLFPAILASGVALVTVSRPTMGPLRMIVGGIFHGQRHRRHELYRHGGHAPSGHVCLLPPGLVLLSVPPDDRHLRSCAASGSPLPRGGQLRLANVRQRSVARSGLLHHALRRHGCGALCAGALHHGPRRHQHHQSRPRQHYSSDPADSWSCLRSVDRRTSFLRAGAAVDG